MGLSMILASALSGTISRTIVHPLDTLRSRLMVSKTSTHLTTTLIDLIRADGIRGLYRGFTVSIALQAPAIATYLSTYEHAKPILCSKLSQSPHSAYVHLSAGMVAESVSAVFWVPMEVIKQRAQIRKDSHARGLARLILRDVLKTDGFIGLFRGYGITLAVYGPHSMLFFASYERLKRMTQAVDTSQMAGCAAGSAGIAAFLTTPLDVVKTRVQTQRNAYRGAIHAMTCIAREEGMASFLRGASARVLWLMPSTAITMSLFEYLKRRFQLVADPIT